MATSNYQLLIDKLNEFIHKYYKNLLLKGGIYAVGLLMLFFISVTYLEYFAWLSIPLRAILFYSFILACSVILIKYVSIPLLKMYQLGKVLTYEEAALIIGKHFTNIQDKLLNILQLHSQASSLSANTSNSFQMNLVEASIDQKIKEVKLIPFSSAIDLKENAKYLKYILIPFTLIVITIVAAPHIFKQGTERLVGYNKEFEKQAPFEFVILNDTLTAVAQQDYLLNVKMEGDEIPENIYLIIDGNEFKLEKENTIKFSYTFKNIQSDIHFRFSANGFRSKEYELKALPNPILLNFEINLQYPSYIHKKEETIKNSGDLSIPAGTNVTWTFNTENTSLLNFSFDDTSLVILPSKENTFDYSSRFLNSKNYSVATTNKFFHHNDAVNYIIDVIPDRYPEIDIEEKKDSVLAKTMYFSGEIKDDYGFSKLTFNYRFTNEEGNNSSEKFIKMTTNTIPIKVNTAGPYEHFYYQWNLNQLNISPGDQIEYYFEVWDNDGVVGYKSTRSQKKTFKMLSLTELEKQAEKNNDQLKDDIEESIKGAKEIQKEISELQRKISEKKSLSWEEKKKLQDLLNKQKELQSKVEKAQKDNRINNQQQNEYKQLDEDILQKQKQLEELFDKVLTPELKQKIDEMNKLLEQLDKNKVQEALEKMKFDNKDLLKELDRNLEIFKQLEVEQKLQESIEKLDQLAEKQNKLAEQTEKKESKSEQLKEQQDQLKKEFEDVQKGLTELSEKNNELEQPKKLEDTQEQQKDINNDLQKSSEELGKNDKKDAAGSQKKAAKKMQEMANQLAEMQTKMESQEQAEDMDQLRSILDNLIHLSFDQENLMGQLARTQTNDPQFFKMNQSQKKLHDDAKMIEDSLFALSKRVPQIEAVVNREISAINMNMEKAIENIAEAPSISYRGINHKQEAISRQQFAMTSINNLALMLNEALDQMQAQARNAKPGSGSCNKPGGKGNPKPSAASIKKMQQQLNEQIKQLKEAMEKGEGQGKEGKGKSGMSKELAKLAAEQEAIRQELNKLSDQLSKEEGGSGNGLGKLADKMEETENDLVNKIIDQETINRQEEILTRLLESEKAEKEREQDEKRQSKESKNENNSNPEKFFEYKGLKEKEEELLKTVPPAFNPFFKEKVNKYFENLED